MKPLIVVVACVFIFLFCLIFLLFHQPAWHLANVCPVDQEVWEGSTPICDKHDVPTHLLYVRWHYDWRHLKLYAEVHK